MKNLIACLVVSVIGIAEMCMAYDVVITQNPDCDTDAGSMVACGSGESTVENWFARNFYIDQDVTINSIHFGNANVTTVSANIFFSIASGPGNPEGVTLTPVGTATQALNAGPWYDTAVDMPFDVSAGSYLVVEFQMPDTGGDPAIYPANTTTATETTYIKTDKCGIVAYVDLAEIGFAEAQMIMCLNATNCVEGYDCNTNGIDDCDDIWDGTSEDCNFNGIPDECDISTGVSQDEDFDGIPDECQDCNGNGILDSIDISNGTSTDCNENGLPDECEDCNSNGIADECDIAEGTSQDIDENGIPDECQDCNNNGIADYLDIQNGTSYDCDQNYVPDECQPDCDGDGWIDPCDNDDDLDGDGIQDNCEEDCNGNTLPDHWEIEMGWVEDCNDNLIPDECDLADGTAEDCNDNLIPDDCDVANGTSQDIDDNGIPDECEIPQTWTVDDDDGKADFDNIQAAVDASSDGDEIIVAPGTYIGTGEEVVNMLGKAVWLHSSGGQEVTIINGQDQRRGILCDSGETSDTVIEGLTISNGYTDFDGGGIATYGTSPMLTDCIFNENNANLGGGMYNENSSPTLTNCTFTDNTAWDGGGMRNENSNPTLENCTFEGNTADFGSGMDNHDSSPTLTDCTFTGNNADDSGGGMANWLTSNPTLDGCTFISNTAQIGGGMYNSTNSSPTLADCTFECNFPTPIEGDWVDDGNNLFLVCCDGDINGDWYVNINDLLAIFGYWGSSIPAGDLNSDGIVNVLDLLIVVSNWGPCP